jgi:hypothetical protein
VHRREGVREGPHAGGGGQVDALQGEPGLEHVRVRVDEGGRHQGPVQVDDVVGVRRQTRGGVLRPDPGHDAVGDEQRLGEGVGGRVDDAVAVQGGAHRPTR